MGTFVRGKLPHETELDLLRVHAMWLCGAINVDPEIAEHDRHGKSVLLVRLLQETGRSNGNPIGLHSLCQNGGADDQISRPKAVDFHRARNIASEPGKQW